MNILKASMKAFLKLSDNAAIFVVLGVGGLMVISGETTLGVIVAFLSGFKRVQEPWDALVEFYRNFADAHIKYGLIRAAMDGAITVEADDAAPVPFTPTLSSA
jgi:ABC-type bacteriocin/lantibiotic exporter with double-glycine peptidase domain